VNRKALLTAIAVALLCVGGLIAVVKRSNSDATAIDPGVIEVSYPILMPELCKTLVEVADGKRTAAYNSFYEKAHAALHVLAADVDRRGERGHQIGTALRLAKSKVEAGIVTFRPTLQSDVSSLIAVAGDALTEVKFSGEKTC
jgi:hypothetical protein